MINIYCESGQFLTLFFNTKIKITEYKSNDDIIGTLEFDGGQKEEFRVRFVTPWMDLVDDIRKKTAKKGVGIKFEDIDHPIFNPKPNSLLIFDRFQYEASFGKFMHDYGFSFLHRLYDIWGKRNVKVIFNFAFWEALMYETTEYGFMTQEFPFENLKLTDYELFEDREGFIFDKLYNLFHYFNILLQIGDNIEFYRENIGKSFKPIDVIKSHYLKLNHTFPKKKLFSHLNGKFRPHRAYFFDKLVENKLTRFGHITASKAAFLQMRYQHKDRHISTDNISIQNEYFFRNWKKDFFDKPWSYYDKFLTETGGISSENHGRIYLEELQYNISYIDIYGETHVLFDTMYPIFTEKGLQPVLFEKIPLLYGGNEFYRVFNNIGGYNFLDELMLPKDYITIKDPYKQVDLIIDSLSKLSKHSFEEIYMESRDKIKNNKNVILDHYAKIISKTYSFILD